MARILRIIDRGSRETALAFSGGKSRGIVGQGYKTMPCHPFSILFICTGNICRSPTADAVLRHMVKDAGLDHLIRVDSAGTHGYHIGQAPDSRAISTALARGVDMRDLRARQVSPQDFHDFDWLIAMDEGHHVILDRLAIRNARGSVVRFLSFTGEPEGDIPDPYYGGQGGFDRVYDMVEKGCRAILDQARITIAPAD